MSSNGGQDGKTEPLTPQELTEVYSWIDAVPLSRQKKNIARDFSDGVAVAKIVQYYLPKMVELQMHNYVNAHSSPQKRINWGLLSKKVFAKLNVKLDDKLVENAIEAKPGAIEQILFDLRKKVIELSPRTISTANLESQNQGRSIFRKTRSQLPAGGKKVPTQAFASVVAVPAAPAPVLRQSRIPPKVTATASTVAKPNPQRSQVPPRRKSPGRVAGVAAVAKKVTPPKSGLKENLNQEPDPCVVLSQELESAVVSSSEVPEECVPPQPEATEPTANEASSPVDDLNANAHDVESDEGVLPPAKLRFKGHDMVPEVMLEESRKQVRDMESIISSLTKKVNFLDNLIAQKDVRLQEVNRQLAKSGNEGTSPY